MSDDLIATDSYDALFGGDKLPSLFNKTHGVGSERSGIIVKAPEDRQSRFYKAGGAGALKFWGEDGKPTDKPTSPSGKAHRPVMDTVFVLDTDYRMTQDELTEADMEEDSGQRGVFAGGDQLRAIREVIKKSGAKTRQDLVGARLTLKRTGKAIKGDFEAWKWAAKIELGVRPPVVNDDEAFE